VSPFRKKTELPRLLRDPRILILPLVLGLLASLGAALKFEMIEEENRRNELDRRQETSHQILVKGLRAYENAVFSLRLVAANNAGFTHENFIGAAQTLIKLNPGIECLQWVSEVPTAMVPAFLASARATVRPDFVLKERSATGQISLLDASTFKPEESLSVITYLYPIAGNENAYGYNVHNYIAKRENGESRMNGSIIGTAVFPLVEGYDGMVLTAYTARAPASLLTPPPQYGPGFTQAVLRLDTILDENLDPFSWQDLDFALYDLTEGTPVALYTRLKNREKPMVIPLAYDAFIGPNTQLRSFKFGGRHWVTAYRWDQKSSVPFSSPGAWLIFAVGLAVTQLGIAYLWIMIRRNNYISQEVANRTAELQDSRALLDLMIDHNPCSIWMKDSELRLRLVNQTFCSYYGRSKAQIIGCTDEDLHIPEVAAEMQAIDREVLASGVPQRLEFKALIEGRKRTFITSKFAIRLANGTGTALVGMSQEITELRDADNRRQKIERKMQEAQKLESLGVLAGGIAHDFNNILSAILGHASLARLFSIPDSRIAQSIEQIELAARRAGELCHQMLAYAGRHRFSIEPLELGNLVREAIPLLEVSLPKSARFRLNLAPDLPSIVADSTQVRQILMNLVINASEALPPHGGEITVSTGAIEADASLFASCIHQPAHPAGPYVCLEVTDTGSGMSAETLAKIFDPFFSTKFTGRGLGLAALLGIIRGHQGAIRVVSQPGAGTSFFIYFPASSTPAPAPTMTAPAPASSPHRILLIEDEPTVRETTRLMLEALGCTVDTAADGFAGVDLFRQDPARPSLVLLDLTMPGLTGREVFAVLRAERPDLPVLFMSGYSELDAEDLLAEPKTDFIPKPFTLKDLRDKIANPVLA
jgi:PAS domain S-box-containing protein